jgi:RNA polymerase sigma-70 factor (ECF subfamily)
MDLQHPYDKLSDEALVKAIVTKDDRRAYNVLFGRIYHPMVQLALYYVKSMEASEDVVSEVLVSFLKNKYRIGDMHNVRGYFYTAVKNQSLKYLRDNKLHLVLLSREDAADHLVPDEDSADRDMLHHEFEQVVRKAIESLPPKRKTIFTLVKENEMKYQEAADLLDISVKTVETQMVLALRSIREVIQAYVQSKDIKVRSINLRSFFL